MRIHPDRRISESRAVTASVQLTADIDIVGALQVSNNDTYFENLASIYLPKDVATPLPAAVLNYKYYRIATNVPVPFMRNIIIAAVAAADEDLVVPDLIKTRSTAIERDEDGNIAKIIKDGGREITINRDEDGNIEEINDETRTWTVGRDEGGNIEEVVVSED
jgi:hypothetical protein